MEIEQDFIPEENLTSLEDSKKDTTEPVEDAVSSFVTDKFTLAQEARRTQESTWLTAYKNYKGVYSEDMQFTEAEKSKVFVKVTKTKVLAAYGQVSEVLLGGSRFPITIDPTTLPDGVQESVHFEMDPKAKEANESQYGADYLSDGLGPLSGKLEGVDVRAGPGTTPSQVTYHPAQVAAKKMEKLIHDQLEESNARKHLRSTAFECVLFGTGIMKGPMLSEKENPKWDSEGNYTPEYKTIPQVTSPSLWDIYFDPDANVTEDLMYAVERHKMSRLQLNNLKSVPLFRSNSISEAVALGTNYVKEHWEEAMSEDTDSGPVDRYEVLEFWGYIDRETLEEDLKFTLPSHLSDVDELNVNAWVCNGKVLRLVVNPFVPARIPYYVVPYEANPYSIYGVGIGDNMADTQQLMNGFMRMAVDNAALSGNMLIEIDEGNLTPGQDLTVYPGKVFRRQSGAPGQAIFGTKFPNVSSENLMLFDKARALSDESTGFPSFAHGQTGVSGVGRTASGISMLMSAANGSIRTVVKNVDDFLLSPLGKALFAFNMQFNFDQLDIVGDLEVKAGATDSLMADEVRSQRLMQFLSVVQNPQLAPFAKLPYLVREIAISMDLDPDKVANSMEDAAKTAEILRQMSPEPEKPQGPERPQGGPQDTQGSGGGTIGTGSVPQPGEQGFSANTGEDV